MIRVGVLPCCFSSKQTKSHLSNQSLRGHCFAEASLVASTQMSTALEFQQRGLPTVLPFSTSKISNCTKSGFTVISRIYYSFINLSTVTCVTIRRKKDHWYEITLIAPRFVKVPNLLVDVDSWRRSACYP